MMVQHLRPASGWVFALLLSLCTTVQGWALVPGSAWQQQGAATGSKQRQRFGIHQSSRSTSRHPPAPRFLMMMLDPGSLAVLGSTDGIVLEMGVALVGAAVGAASQLPRVQNLQTQLTQVQNQLAARETELNQQIHVLEEKLFAMDQEFEQQTTRFQKDYDQTQKKRLQEIKEKLQTELQFKLEIQLAQQKSRGLMAALTDEHGRTAKQEQLCQLTLRSSQLEKLNAELQATLQKTEEELQHLRETAAAARKKGRFPFW